MNHTMCDSQGRNQMDDEPDISRPGLRIYQTGVNAKQETMM